MTFGSIEASKSRKDKPISGPVKARRGLARSSWGDLSPLDLVGACLKMIRIIRVAGWSAPLIELSRPVEIVAFRPPLFHPGNTRFA